MKKKESMWMKVNTNGTLPGDHDSDPDYHVLTNAINSIPSSKEGLSCEIGLRKGGSTGHIIEALSKRKTHTKVHVAVDPYGNIVYADADGVNKRLNYSNEMRDKYIGSIYMYAMEREVNLVFINLDDEEFMTRYTDGVPFYEEKKRTLNEFIFVHLDGPHQKDPVLREFLWFDERMTSGAAIVFDDINNYDHAFVEKVIFQKGWKKLEQYGRKISYKKENF